VSQLQLGNAVLRHHMRVLRHSPTTGAEGHGSSLPRRGEPGALPGPVGVVHGYAPDSSEVAPEAREAEVDLRSTRAREAGSRPPDPRPRHPPGKREPEMGLREDPRASSASSGSTSVRAPSGGSCVVPASGRRLGGRDPTWSEFLRAQARGVLTCDVFTVETVFLKTIYVLFFHELSTRRVHVTGATSRPDSAQVTQQARNLSITGGLRTSASCSGTETPSTLGRSTRSSERRVSGS
jgi:hypothetical protein